MFLIEEMKLLNGKKINFTLKDNEDKIIRGPNGAGKSLFLKSLAHLLPTDYKKFIYNNLTLSEWKANVYRSQVIYVHQSIPTEPVTVEEYLSFPTRFSIYKNHTPILNHKQFTDKWEISYKEIHHLSMGQRQLLCLLRALSLNAKVLLLDEPFSHLDQSRTLEAEQLLHEWKEKTQGSLIIVSHDDTESSRMNIPEISLTDLIKH